MDDIGCWAQFLPLSSRTRFLSQEHCPWGRSKSLWGGSPTPLGPRTAGRCRDQLLEPSPELTSGQGRQPLALYLSGSSVASPPLLVCQGVSQGHVVVCRGPHLPTLSPGTVTSVRRCTGSCGDLWRSKMRKEILGRGDTSFI